ncbi:MAG: acetyl-CoA C-acyltransferase, partial [Candidatus Eiseniibacteriota bacterium]
QDPVVLAAVRTAVGKAPRGTLRATRADEMAAAVLTAALDRVPGLEPAAVDDVILGCAFPEGPQGMNVARIAALRAGLPESVPAMTVNRFCASGLQSIAQAAERIASGQATAILAGGAESMSLVPMGGERFLPNPELVELRPGVYLNMGLTAERLVDEYAITREMQDAFAAASHAKAVAAIAAGRFADEIVPLTVRRRPPPAAGGGGTAEADGTAVAPRVEETTFAVDEGPRADTSVEALARLKPVFKQHGTVTAGNASQTSDGAAVAVVAAAGLAAELGLRPLAWLRGYAVAGVAPERMGIGPVEAIPRVLEPLGLTLDDIDLFELNEAFAAQALAVLRELRIPEEKVNPNGGAVALGHPLGATGAKLTVSLLHEMQRRQVRYGVVSMCVGGGMGAAAVFERFEGPAARRSAS